MFDRDDAWEPLDLPLDQLHGCRNAALGCMDNDLEACMDDVKSALRVLACMDQVLSTAAGANREVVCEALDRLASSQGSAGEPIFHGGYRLECPTLGTDHTLSDLRTATLAPGFGSPVDRPLLDTLVRLALLSECERLQGFLSVLRLSAAKRSVFRENLSSWEAVSPDEPFENENPVETLQGISMAVVMQRAA